MCISAVAYALSGVAAGSLTFFVLWGFAAMVLAQNAGEERLVWWGLAGIVLGPFVAAWLSWRYARDVG